MLLFNTCLRGCLLSPYKQVYSIIFTFFTTVHFFGCYERHPLSRSKCLFYWVAGNETNLKPVSYLKLAQLYGSVCHFALIMPLFNLKWSQTCLQSVFESMSSCQVYPQLFAWWHLCLSILDILEHIVTEVL